jgi:hypothetical protein
MRRASAVVGGGGNSQGLPAQAPHPKHEAQVQLHFTRSGAHLSHVGSGTHSGIAL